MSFKLISAILLLSLSTFFTSISGQSKISYDLDGNPVYEIRQGEKGPEIRFFPASGNTQQKSTQTNQTNLSSNKTNESQHKPVSDENNSNSQQPQVIVHNPYSVNPFNSSVKNCEPRPRFFFPLFNPEEYKELNDLKKITDSEALITRLNHLLEQKHKKEASSWSYTGDDPSFFIFYGITGVTSYKTLNGDFFYVRLSYILDLRMTSDNTTVSFDFYQPLSLEALQQLIEDLISKNGVPLTRLRNFHQKEFIIGTNQSIGPLLLTENTFIIINNDLYTPSLAMLLKAFSDAILLLK